MQNRGGDRPRITPSEPALRIIMRRLREIMAEPSDGQSRLDKIVRQIAGLMVAEVCSIYLKRQDGSLELFATEGLNPGAVHNTFMKRGEGLVGRCAELAVPINEPDAQNHPAFSYRPETGEEIYHSFLAVPVLRGGDVLGVLTVQNKTHKEYSDEDVEVLQTTAMVLAEHLVSGAVAGVNTGAEFSRAVGHVVRGQPLSEGLALGHVVLHEPRVVVTELEAKDPDEENRRLEAAVEELKASIDEMLEQGELAATGEHREVLEAYRMFAHDRGWLRRMKEAIKRGMTAEAAVERVQNDTRARMLRQADAYWHERLRDLDELSDRLLRILSGRPSARTAPSANLPHDTVLVARTMGPADLLDYDRSRLRGLVIEDSRRPEPRRHRRQGARHRRHRPCARRHGARRPGQSHHRRRRQRRGAHPPVQRGDRRLRRQGPLPARRHRKYRALRDRPAVTKDGQRIELHINAGLLMDVPHLAESGADGIGLFRTELQFMMSATLPRLERQTQMYRAVVARGRRQAGRVPHARRRRRQGAALSAPAGGGEPGARLARHPPGARPARPAAHPGARPARATAGAGAAPAAADGDRRRRGRHGARARSTASSTCCGGAACAGPDQGAARRHDRGALAALRARRPAAARRLRLGRQQRPAAVFLRRRPQQHPRRGPLRSALGRTAAGAGRHRGGGQRQHGRPLSLCGEMAGRPLEAMALIGLGYRSISMAPASVGPVKSMILSLDAGATCSAGCGPPSAAARAACAPAAQALSPRNRASRSDLPR